MLTAKGVVLWEVFTLCEADPYSALSNSDVKNLLKHKDDVTQYLGAMHIHQDIIELMKNCLKYEPTERPSFEQIEGMLSDIGDSLSNEWPEKLGKLDKTTTTDGGYEGSEVSLHPN